MRGSIYYQIRQIVKLIFKESTKKNNEHFNCVSAFKTIETYSFI